MRIALVHDYLTQLGGAERVLEALHQLYPDAPVFTSIANRDQLPASWASWDIHESPLRLAPGAVRWHRAALPIYPALFRGFGPELRAYDLVISDSSAWAHHASVGAEAVHVCYCHSPARFLYGDPAYLGPARIPPPFGLVARLSFPILRRWDRRAAARVDQYVANSRVVAERIRRAYGRVATVVYPPVDIERFATAADLSGTGDWYVVVSRLVPHKRVDLAVAAFDRLGLRLKIVGDGRAAAALRRVRAPNVEFLGVLGDDATAEVVAGSRGLVLPAGEDFGITAVEAQAAGRPVVAFGAGGALESVVAGETGVFFAEPTVEALIAAVRTCEKADWDRERIRANAARFGRDRFIREMEGIVEEVWNERG